MKLSGPGALFFKEWFTTFLTFVVIVAFSIFSRIYISVFHCLLIIMIYNERNCIRDYALNMISGARVHFNFNFFPSWFLCQQFVSQKLEQINYYYIYIYFWSCNRNSCQRAVLGLGGSSRLVMTGLLATLTQDSNLLWDDSVDHILQWPWSLHCGDKQLSPTLWAVEGPQNNIHKAQYVY